MPGIATAGSVANLQLRGQASVALRSFTNMEALPRSQASISIRPPSRLRIPCAAIRFTESPERPHTKERPIPLLEAPCRALNPRRPRAEAHRARRRLRVRSGAS